MLSGGNALGAYQGGAYAALQEAGWEPDWVVGTSAGANNAAIICGNPPALRVGRLKELWRPDPGFGSFTFPYAAAEEARRTFAALTSATMGQPGLFAPNLPYFHRWDDVGGERAAIYDSTPMRDTFVRLVDFDRLNSATPRFTATAIDLETGEDQAFDTSSTIIHPDHLRASSALLPAFPPVRIDGRWYGDGGLSANLPLDPVLADDDDAPLLCVAIDLLPLRGPAPRTFGDSIVRAQDLMFASQSRRTIMAWQRTFDERVKAGQARHVTLIHMSYADPAREVSGKAFDFSGASGAARWDAGYADMKSAIDAVSRATQPPAPGLHVIARGGAAGAFPPARHA